MSKKAPYWVFIADVHAGDIPGGIPQREEDIYRTFQNICQEAAKDPACLGILGGGDLRDKPTIQTRNLDGFNAGIAILHNAQKMLLTIIGNHDMTNPTWVKAMHHPSLGSLTDHKTLIKQGLDPETFLASDYKNKADLREWLENIPLETRQNAKTVVLHLALAELCVINQKAEISLPELKELGFGSKGKVTFLLGDIHNFGDITLDNIEAVYPGSIEMTDRNEGVNGFKSTRYPTMKPEFEKFVLHWYPQGINEDGEPEWERIPVPSRPWYYVKIAKTKEKKAQAELEMAFKAVSKWDVSNPGILNLILPEKEIEEATAQFQKLKDLGKILQINIEAYSKEIHGTEEEDEPPRGGSGSWDETKTFLPEMAEDSKMSPRAKELLKQLIAGDKSTHSVKGDVTNAWDTWKKIPENPSTTPDTNLQTVTT